MHVHDGSTAGGFELMRADGANSTVTLGDISGVTAGTGLSGGGTTGTVTLDIDGTVATLAGTQTFTNKTLTSPILNTPTIGTSFHHWGRDYHRSRVGNTRWRDCNHYRVKLCRWRYKCYPDPDRRKGPY